MAASITALLDAKLIDPVLPSANDPGVIVEFKIGERSKLTDIIRTVVFSVTFKESGSTATFEVDADALRQAVDAVT